MAKKQLCTLPPISPALHLPRRKPVPGTSSHLTPLLPFPQVVRGAGTANLWDVDPVGVLGETEESANFFCTGQDSKFYILWVKRQNGGYYIDSLYRYL